MGTMRYLAPEVLAGESATPVSDLYALGMLLRDCLGEGGGPLAAFADRLTAREPGERPASAADALALLDGAAGEDPTEATLAMTDVTRPIPPIARGASGKTPAGARRPVEPSAPARRGLPRPVAKELPDGRREYELRVGGRAVALALGVIAVVVLVIVLASGGGGSAPATPARSAPLERQLEALDRQVKALD